MTVAENTLYVVATPIGNLDDISLRALAVLGTVDRIYAEDTRHSAGLLAHHRIRTRMVSLHEHNETARAAEVVDLVSAGITVALITDAGTPLLSDPGYRLVGACHAAGIRVSPVPGASALLAALCVSGQPTDRFEFTGFPPAKHAARRRWLLPLLDRPHTVVLFESTHRIVDTLSDICGLAGEARDMTLARELTKRFETVIHAPVGRVRDTLVENSAQQRGEFVLLLSPATPSRDGVLRNIQLDELLQRLLGELPAGTAARIAASLFDLPRQRVYARALELQQRQH